MPDDIVTRLREDLTVAIKFANSTALADLLTKALVAVVLADQQYREAADEIERLRAEIERLKNDTK